MSTIDFSKINLPIVEVLNELISNFESSHNLILNAEAGAGKSTIVPLALLDLVKDKNQKIIMLEPRRLAAKTIAQRMAYLLGEEVGRTVGYRIRFETRISEETRIEVVTEGILNKMMDSDPELKEVGILIFDEFHERSIHADVALALARYTQQKIRPDLRMLIMSATLDQELLSTALQAKVISAKGRQYPVEIIYSDRGDHQMITELITEQIKHSIKNDEGDILVFLPGQGEILRTEELLRKAGVKADIHPLYGQLPWNKQQRAIVPNSHGKRKIVLATSIAETSLTIEGIKVVIDSGLKKNSVFDPNTALNSLKTQSISQDEATQRAGRAGRLSPGKCYRMWSENEQNLKSSHRQAEILHADLSTLRLDLAARNIKESEGLFWLTPPPLDKILYAEDLLLQLDALTQDYQITDLGKKMHQLPCHPRLAHMLVKSDSQLPLAIDLASLLEEKDPLYKKTGTDLSERIDHLRKFRAENRLGRSFQKIEKIAASYRTLFKTTADNEEADPHALGFLLAMAYPDRIATARRGNNAQFQLANGSLAMIGHKDELADESWITVASMDARQGMGKIFLAAALNPKDLMPLLKNEENAYWDYEEDEFYCSQELSIGNIILKSERTDEAPTAFEKRKAIIKALNQDPEELLEELIDEELSAEEYTYLGKTARKWLPEGIENVENILAALKKLPLATMANRYNT